MKSQTFKTFRNMNTDFFKVAIFYLLGFLLFILFSNKSPVYYTLVNLVVFILSWFIVCTNLYSLKIQGLRFYHVFFVPFYVSLAWNTFNMSKLQFPKTFSDLYYYFLGPILFGLLLMLAEHIKIPKWKKAPPFRVSLMFVIWSLIFLFVFAKIWVFNKVGIRLFDYISGDFSGRQSQGISFFSGIASIAQWTLLILIPYLKKRMIILVVTLVTVFSGILAMKRGAVIRVVVFLLLLYLIQKKRSFNKKAITYLTIFFIVFVLLFPLLGQVRQSYEAKFNINNLLKSENKNLLIGWFYSYSALNFDVLKLYMEQKPHNYPHALLMPLVRLWNNKDAINKHLETVNKLKLGAFNAATFLGPFVRDFGSFYIIELIIFGFVLFFIIIGIRIFDLKGVYAYLMLLIFLMFFGNYVILPSFFYTIFIASILIIITRPQELSNR